MLGCCRGTGFLILPNALSNKGSSDISESATVLVVCKTRKFYPKLKTKGSQAVSSTVLFFPLLLSYALLTSLTFSLSLQNEPLELDPSHGRKQKEGSLVHPRSACL